MKTLCRFCISHVHAFWLCRSREVLDAEEGEFPLSAEYLRIGERPRTPGTFNLMGVVRATDPFVEYFKYSRRELKCVVHVEGYNSTGAGVGEFLTLWGQAARHCKEMVGHVLAVTNVSVEATGENTASFLSEVLYDVRHPSTALLLAYWNTASDAEE